MRYGKRVVLPAYKSWRAAYGQRGRSRLDASCARLARRTDYMSRKGVLLQFRQLSVRLEGRKRPNAGDVARANAAAAFPTWIHDDCRVRWATGERGLQILNRLTRISLDLQGDFEVAFESQRAARNTGPILKVLAFRARHGNWRFISESLLRARWEHVQMLFRWIFDLAGAPRK